MTRCGPIWICAGRSFAVTGVSDVIQVFGEVSGADGTSEAVVILFTNLLTRKANSECLYVFAR